MTTATVSIELPRGTTVAQFESDLARLAAKYGTNLERSGDPRHPCAYYLRQRYVPSASVVPLRRPAPRHQPEPPRAA